VNTCVVSDSRVAKLLNMLSSSFDGERANAGRMIADMAAKDNKTVADFVMRGGTQIVERVVYRDRTVYKDREPEPRQQARQEDYPKRARPKASNVLKTLYWALQYYDALTQYEIDFATDILVRGDPYLSERQLKVIRRIIAKAQAANEPPLM